MTNVEAFYSQGLGFTPEEIERLRDQLLEPAPQS